MTPALDRLLSLVRLESPGVAEGLAEIARDSTAANFHAQQTPAGDAWPELSSAYAAEKARLFPGQPTGVREGLLRDDVDGAGETAASPGEVVWTFGQTADGRSECAWLSDGDPHRNRPPRPFVGLNAEALTRVETLISEKIREALEP